MMDQLRESAELPGEQVLHRISGLTLGVGFATAALALALHRPDWARGVAGGAVLGWLNFRWLRRGIRAMVTSAMTQVEPQRENLVPASDAARSPAASTASLAGTYLALLFRYALVAIGVYVIFSYLHVPVVSIGLGLCAFIAAIIGASVWEIVRPGQ